MIGYPRGLPKKEMDQSRWALISAVHPADISITAGAVPGAFGA